MKFPEGRKVKKGESLPVIVETAAPLALLRFCFKNLKGKNLCTFVELKRKGYSPITKRIPLTTPRINYEELK